MTDSLLKVAEVAAQLRVSDMTVYRLIQSGELPCVRVRHSFRIRKSEFAAYVSRNEDRTQNNDNSGPRVR